MFESTLIESETSTYRHFVEVDDEASESRIGVIVPSSLFASGLNSPLLSVSRWKAPTKSFTFRSTFEPLYSIRASQAN